MAARSALINVMTLAAQKAGRRLVRDFGEVENLQVSRKGPADFVSAADTKAEKILFDELNRARPRFGFLMEERGEVAGPDTSHRWIVDPLDGTTNFLHGIPHFAISIALEQDGQIIAGVIYEPLGDEMFWAEKGIGAFLGGRRLRVSGRRKTEDSLFATGIPFLGRGDHPAFLKEMEAVMACSAGVRRFGSAALDMAWVAAGRYDGFWESGLESWDLAAGVVLIKEAGGYIRDMDGGTDMVAKGSVVAANDHLQHKLFKILKTARR